MSPTYVIYLDDRAVYGVMSGEDSTHIVVRAEGSGSMVSFEAVEIFDNLTAALDRAEYLNR